jgi:5-methylcytosine-specific restriction endonuclease McrA
MRYINAGEIGNNLPDGWRERAQEAHQSIRGLTPEERSIAIDNNSGVWKELKNILKSISKGKCWYCESKQERSDNAVDHYRPKNRIAECPGHHGYWWLAFDWSNYRYSCTYCNSSRVDKVHGTAGGKHDHFPLLDEARRIHRETDGLDAEQPLLLDPIRRGDPAHLWFDEDGQARPNPALCSDESSYPYKRADTSIKLYHLNHVDTVENRKALCQSIKKSVQQADVFYKKYSDNGDMTAKASFENTVTELHDKLKADAEYSAAARSILMGLRGTYPVAEVILSAA